MILAFILPALLLLALAVEALIVSRHRSSIPLRVHVNGTRGKSTVVRLIVGGLRAGGKRTIGKVTGVVPTLLMPDGSEERIARRGPARVQEQVQMIVRAGRLKCDALVMECMSIEPQLQRFESEVLRPRITVLTNIREDHLEVPKRPADLVNCIGGLFALSRGTLITSERRSEEIRQRRSDHGLPTTVPGALPKPDHGRIEGETAAENINLALAACVQAGIPEELALEGILDQASRSDARALVWKTDGVERVFFDGFSVNDVESAARFIEERRAGGEIVGELVVILNARSDRPLRTRQFARWIGTRKDVRGVVVCGTHRQYCRRTLRKAGFPESVITEWDAARCVRAVENCELLSPGPGLFIGLMNTGGMGFVIRDAFRALDSGRRLTNGH